MYFILFLLWDSLLILRPVEITKNANSKRVIIIIIIIIIVILWGEPTSPVGILQCILLQSKTGCLSGSFSG